MTNAIPLDYRSYLDESFKTLLKKNPRLSMRALAKKASISPAYLSRVLNGKRALSVQVALKLARALDLNDKKARQFVDLVEYQTSSEKNKEALLKKMVAKNARFQERNISLEKFKLISDWQHFAVLNLFSMKDFTCDVRIIAARLGLNGPEVRLTLMRLEQVGALTRNKKGHLTLAENSDYLSTGDDVSSAAIKEHHRQIIQLATLALDKQNLEQREFQSLMLPLKSDRLPQAKERIRDFIEAFNNEFADLAGQDLFACSVQLFALTKNIKKNQKKENI